MKQGRTLEDLAREITRRSEAKVDLVAPTTAMKMTAEFAPNMEREVALELTGRDPFAINSIGHDQIGLYTGIPAKYYDRMLAERPALLAENVNTWLHAQADQRMVRTLDGKVRAFLSDSYRPLENEQLAEAVLPILLELDLMIASCEITDRKLYIKAVDQRVSRDIPTGRSFGDGSHEIFDTCCPAIIISNSEVGLGALSIDTGMLTKACTNLVWFFKDGMRRRHVGSKLAGFEGEEVRHLLTDDTKRATDKAVWMQVSDVVRGAFEEAKFEERLVKVGKLAAIPLEGDPVKVIDLTAKRFNIAEGEKGSILQHLIRGGDLTAYGLFNAVTRTAEDAGNYDRATELEQLGGQIIELPRNDWQRINAEAKRKQANDAEPEKVAA
jgi:hypothetical protein